MHLSDIQREAYDCAQAKGLHEALDGVSSLGVREHALMRLAPVYIALSKITQHIKRHGLEPHSWRRHITLLVDDLQGALYAFEMPLALGTMEPLTVEPANDIPATIIRLVLAHTEIDEALELLDMAQSYPENKEPIALSKTSLAAEIADTIIRLCDLAETLDINLNDAIASKLAYNRNRNHKFGTPGEVKTDA